MSIQAAKFQTDAADAAVAAFKRGRPCYLIADETGLGKTIVARMIIEKMSQQKKQNKPFKVYYFGSNQMLLGETIKKLMRDTSGWIHWNAANNVTKLGMMAYRPLSSKSNVCICGFSGNLLGNIGGSTGDNQNERPYYKFLLNKYSNLVNTLNGIKDCNTVMGHWNNEKDLKEIDVTSLRKYFEKHTLTQEPPDLIIMDEFHRYDGSVDYLLNLLKKIKDENKKDERPKVPPVLLLSATPYNFYGNPRAITIDELPNAFEDEDINSSTKKITSFEKLLEYLDYLDSKNVKIGDDSCKLSLVELYTCFKNSSKKKEDLEKFSHILIDNCIYRNERLSDGSEKYLTLPTAEDFEEYFAPCIIEEKKLRIGDCRRYRILCSGVCSFPIKYYKPGKKEQEFYEDLPKPDGQTVPKDDWFDDWFIFDDEQKLKRDGGDFNNLRLACIEHYNAKPGRDLLWVPPTKQEYEPGGVFSKQKNFSKLMIFSAYKMVPRIVSGVFSAYVSDDVTVVKPVDLSSIDNVMKPLVQGREKELNDLYKCLICGNAGIGIEELVEKLAKKLPECKYPLLLAKYVIGSPYMCAYRTFGNSKAANEIADAFNTYFKKEGIRQAIAHNGIVCPEKLLEYCIDGGLGAVLKEYAFCGGTPADLKTALRYGKSNPTIVRVYSRNCYKNFQKPFTINCHYAERFNTDFNDQNTTSTMKNGEEHFEQCQTAFNSPFWPMILCTTSANQEGHDLDTYCSRIMHYSLPPNTMSFEQRDGRINRRRSLLARRRMVQMYGSDMPWNTIFTQLRDRSGMSPDWTQDGYFGWCDRNKRIPLKLERIVPYFPMTDEYYAYDVLKDLKNKYRSHFGMPDESGAGRSDTENALKLNDL